MIFGAGEFAQVIQSYTGEGLTVHREFLSGKEVPFDKLSPTRLLICVGDNYARKRVLDEARERGHLIGSWAHPRQLACLWPLNPNTFLFDYNSIQPYCEIGENTVVWCANHLGHHSKVGDNCFITSHVCIGGGAEIGDYSFIGMNATVFDHVKVGAHCIIAAGAVVDRDIPEGHTLSRKGILTKHEVAQA